ncbi:hypothetical protein FQN50_007648 [Emmonsiellopsis sp. PD_5]|nr:hypothetical protein FQN50_007648 [Emmonsiellopsis sp. PD_5]
MGKARERFPHLYLRHEVVNKELSQLRKTLTNNTRQTTREEYFHNAPVLEVDRQIKQLLSQSDAEDCDADNSEDEDWELPIPEYIFPERGRLVENFYGSEAENFDEDRLLARLNWDIDDDDKLEKSEEPLLPGESLECPTDVCIICCGLSCHSASNPPPHKFPSKRKDSLRRHLIESHLSHVHDRISCTWPACRDVPEFTTVTEFLAHAVTVHVYDVHIKVHSLPKKPRLTCSDTSSVNSTEASLELDGRSGTDTPASSVGPETANVDPLLLESHKATITEPPPRRSKRLRLE